jgi:pimeloyl-ACP methyl ester carboxylesterase
MTIRVRADWNPSPEIFGLEEALLLRSVMDQSCAGSNRSQPLTSLSDDVNATRRIMALQDGPVILVGHSWGGAVITLLPEAANKLAVSGAKAAATPREASEGNDFIIAMVSNDEASRQVWLDRSNGALVGASSITERTSRAKLNEMKFGKSEMTDFWKLIFFVTS